MSVHVVKSTIS